MVGRSLAHYQIRERLGQGGMGEVYRATDSRLKRDVALKLLPAEVAADPVHLARLQREAEAIAALSHPHIVQIYSIEEAEGQRFLTMELVEGQSLDRLLPPGGMPLSQLLAVGCAVADALAAAHAKGIVHRDLKPANVMLSQTRRVKVLDFGLAKHIEDSNKPGAAAITAAMPLTAQGTTIGTVPYMSPEQLRGERIDARSDIFAFGIMMHELAIGHRPFVGNTSSDMVSSILRDQPSILTAVRPELPRHLGRIVTRCLEKDIDRRYQSAVDLRNDLEGLREELRSQELLDSGSIPVAAPAAGKSSAAPQARKRPARRWIGAAAAVLALAVAVALFVQRDGSDDDGRQPASAQAPSTVAVLPFKNLSSDPDQDYFSDGLTEELSNTLVKIPQLRVAGRISAATIKKRTEDLQTIARQLNVAHLVEGSVRKSGDQIRITVQLISAADGFQLWSQTYDRTLEDVFAVQEDIAQSVARELRATLLGNAVTEHPKASAYDLVLRSRYVLQNSSGENIRRAKEMLEEATKIEPGYARAWAAMGLVNFREYEAATVAEAKQAAIERAREALTHALELDPTFAVAHSQMIGVHIASWEFTDAERRAERALALEPRNPTVMGNAAYLFRGLGRVDEAIALEERILASEPLALNAYNNLAASYTLASRWADAESTLVKLLRLEPKFVAAHSQLGTVHLMQGRRAEARAAYARFTELSGWGDYGRLFYDALVRPGDEAAVEAFEDRFATEDPSGCAQIRAFHGEADAAFAWLDKAFERRDPYLAFVKADLFLRPIYADPRWTEMLRRIGLPTG